jgi:uncharacterized delta-60 repeat protein
MFTCELLSQSIDPKLNLHPILDVNYGSVASIEVQDDQKIILQGRINYVENVPVQGIVRYQADGKLDTTFNIGIGFDSHNLKMKLQNDNKLLVWGYFTTFNGNKVTGGIARLNQDGSLDNLFHVEGGVSEYDRIEKVDFQSDGKVIVSGFFRSFNSDYSSSHLIRLNSTGTVDNTFKYNGLFKTGVVKTKVLKDDKILVLGINLSNSGSLYSLSRLNSDGSIDETFKSGEGTPGTVYDFDVLSDGQIVVVGDFESYNGTPRKRIVCLNSDGSINTGFYYSSGANYVVTRILALKGDDIFVAGYFDTYEGNAANNAIRLKANGTIDLAFKLRKGIYNYNEIEEQKDGKLLISGSIDDYDGVNVPNIVRLNNDASLDRVIFNNSRSAGFNCLAPTKVKNEYFAIGSFSMIGKDSILSVLKMSNKRNLNKSYKIDVDPRQFSFANYGIIDNNENLLVSGYVGSAKIIKFNKDGLKDTDFNFVSGNNNDAVHKIYNQQNKYLVHFYEWTSFGNKPYKLRRINLNGTDDSSFPEVIGNKNIHAVKVLQDNKLILGGDFDSLQRVPNNTLVLLDENGSVIKGYGNIFSTSSKVFSIEVDDNQNIFVGGILETSKGSRKVVKIKQDGSIDESFSFIGENYQYVKEIKLYGDKVIVVGIVGNYDYLHSEVEEIVILDNKGVKLPEWKAMTFIDISGNTDRGIRSTLLLENSLIVAGNFSMVNNKNQDGLVKIDLPTNNQSITFNSIPNILEDKERINLTATSSSGLPVAFEVTSGDATLSGSQLSFKNAGKITVTARQEGDSLYWSAKDVSQTFCIIPSIPTITVLESTNSIYLVTDAKYDIQWYYGNEKINNATNDTLKVEKTGSYYMTVSTQDCFSNSTPFVVTADEKQPESEKMIIYPVPVLDYLNIEFKTDTNRKAQLFRIYNSLGALVMESSMENSNDGYATKVDVRGLAAGFYHFVIFDNQVKTHRTFIKI